MHLTCQHDQGEKNENQFLHTECSCVLCVCVCVCVCVQVGCSEPEVDQSGKTGRVH